MRAGEATSTSRPTVPPSFPSGPGEPQPAADLPADLHWFLDDGRPPGGRDAPARTLALASSLYERLGAGDGAQGRATLAQRIVTDDVLRREADRDQNVYLGPLFTRVLSHAVPDVVFLPETVAEVEETLRWARENAVPVTLRAAASSALGGSVPCDGGLTLDLSRLDHIDVDAGDNVCVIGAGARLRAVHRRLARHDLALPVYPSNLGATFAGWLAGGGVGVNAFGRRRALDIVRAADVVLPSGRLVRFDSDGRMDVPADPPHRGHREVAADAAEAWFREQGLEPMTFADLAGSEGVLGTIVQLVLAVGRRPSVGAFLLRFDAVPDAFAAIDWVAAEAGRSLPRPANLKLVFGSFVRHQRAVWADEARRGWRRLPSDLSAGAGMPWRRIAGPHELGVSVVEDDGDGAAYVYVDFLGLTAARAFGARLPQAPGAPAALGEESVRFSAERFRPQQSKRLGPGLLAAEVVLPARNVSSFLREAWHLGRGAGLELDPEVYYVADGEALVIAGYLTDHRTAAFYSDLVLAPALLDMAAGRFDGRPYVLGRWQASFVEERFGANGLARLRRLKETHDPDALLNRGVVLGMGLRGLPGRAVGAVYKPGVGVARRAWTTPGLSTLARGARRLLGRLPGPASGRGEPVGGDGGRPRGGRESRSGAAGTPDPLERAIGCVNCGECNSTCPAYAASCVRLPQTLTHRAEALAGGEPPGPSTTRLIELCLRCGNCEEVCQAGISHLAVFARLDAALAAAEPPDFARQARVLSALRGSSGYRDGFLEVRPGIYLRRSPASLPGALRYRVLRAENEAGPAATCLHCAACVPVCPTGANREFDADDARLITTDEMSCIGCGSCVEVCPANKLNGGQTLRVVEQPAPDWLAAVAEYDAAGLQSGANAVAVAAGARTITAGEVSA